MMLIAKPPIVDGVDRFPGSAAAISNIRGDGDQFKWHEGEGRHEGNAVLEEESEIWSFGIYPIGTIAAYRGVYREGSSSDP